MKRILTAVTMLCSLLLVGTFAEAGYRVSRETRLEACRSMAYAGSSLSEQDAKDLEAQLRKDPADADSRVQLIGYYSHRAMGAGRNAPVEEWIGHLTWLVKNQPEADILGVDSPRLNRYQSPENWDRLKELWLEAIRKHRNDARVLGNAAGYLSADNTKLGAELLERAISLDPDDPYWHKRLASAYESLARRAQPDEKKNLWERTIAELEKAFQLQRGHRKQFLLNDIAEAALEAGDTTKARDRATEVLAAESSGTTSYFRQKAEIVLARVALASGDRAAMRDYMKKACQDAADPAVRVAMPSFELIGEMLSAGDKDDALEYLKLCETAWPESVGKIRDMASLVKQGRTPSITDWYTNAAKPASPSATTSR